MARGRRSFGNVRRLPSKRWQARYTGPDGKLYSARDKDGKPLTFDTKRDADLWLSLRQADVTRNKWVPEVDAQTARPLTLREYADPWLAERPLEVRTTDLYRGLLKNHIYPTFGDTPLPDIIAKAVRTWYARLGTQTGPTARSNAYGLLHTILNTAVDDEMILANPCRVRGGGSKRAKVPEPATVDELVTMVQAMPAKYQLMVLLAAWCAPRFGELCELRRSDIDLEAEVVWIRRSVARTARQGRIIKLPKSEAGYRSVDIPPHIIPAIVAHLAEHAGRGPNGLLFPGTTKTGHISEKSLAKFWHEARAAAGREDLKWHGLRHTGATLASEAGASIKEVMVRLGHSTPAAAMIYQHVAAHRGKAIAATLSTLATGNVTPIAAAPSAKKRSA